jgi:hypothetical protein
LERVSDFEHQLFGSRIPTKQSEGAGLMQWLDPSFVDELIAEDYGTFKEDARTH